MEYAQNEKSCGYFNPRPPRGGRPRFGFDQWEHVKISIHAPREGGDLLNPLFENDTLKFQSTPPARGATRLTG